MSKIDTTQWKEYSISDLFITEVVGRKIQVPTGSYIERKSLKEGETPRITVTGINNGICGYFEDLTNNSNYRVFENFISVSFLGTVFYHPYKASLDMKVHALKLKDKQLNEYIGGYIVSIIKKSIQNNNYSDQLSSTVLPQLKIRLPVDINGNPNFAYMEEYMQNLESAVSSSLTALRSVKNLRDSPIDTNSWGIFAVGAIFKIVKPQVYHTREIFEEKDGIPYVVRSKFNNGIKCYVKRPNGEPNPARVISFGAENATFFYQENEWISGRDMYYIDTRAIDKYVCLFITACLQPIAQKYSYNFGLFPELLRKEKIKLPVAANGNIDYDYMANYMRNLELKTAKPIYQLA